MLTAANAGSWVRNKGAYHQKAERSGPTQFGRESETWPQKHLDFTFASLLQRLVLGWRSCCVMKVVVANSSASANGRVAGRASKVTAMTR